MTFIIHFSGGEHAEEFRNRKGFFSLNVQVVCDHDMKIRDIVARWPGSVHDATIFQHSRLCQRLQAGEFHSGILLGDSGYPIKKYLLTPLLNPTNVPEERYNNAHVRTRNIVERVFGVWKRRFSVLSLGMRVKIETVQDIIVATAVLHNIARTQNEEEPPMHIDFPDEEIGNDNMNQLPVEGEDNHVRRTLINQYFSRYVLSTSNEKIEESIKYSFYNLMTFHNIFLYDTFFSGYRTRVCPAIFPRGAWGYVVRYYSLLIKRIN